MSLVRRGWRGILPGAWCALALLPSPADAEIVRLTNGRSLSVETCVFENDVAVLVMPNGGEIRVPRSMVEDIAPDELPLLRAEAEEARAASAWASRGVVDPAAIRVLVDETAVRVGIDRRLAHAVVRVESNYQPLAISRKGAMGLMQLLPATARAYAVEDPFDPEQNLAAGMRHLRGLLVRFDISRALAAYNAGETAVLRYGGVPPYRETQDYVRRILELVK